MIWWSSKGPFVWLVALKDLSTLTADAAGKLDVLRHDCDALRVNRAQVGVLKEANQVAFASLLQSHDGSALEAQVSLEILSDFADKTLERQLADQQLSRLLVTADLTKRNGTGTVTMRLLHTTGRRSALTRSLSGQLLSRGLATGRLTRSLLCTSHC